MVENHPHLNPLALRERKKPLTVAQSEFRLEAFFFNPSVPWAELGSAAAQGQGDGH